MVEAKRRETPDELWARLQALSPLEKGEIIDGDLFVQPRPRFKHGRVNGFLARHVGGGFDFDEHGPGGWWILVEPGIELPGAPEVSPDLAGWRRARLPVPPDDEPIRVVPDWVCEVLSPSNARYDRLKKFPYYARIGVAWLWVVDPREPSLEVRQLVGQDGKPVSADATPADGTGERRWLVVQSFGPEELVRAQPFEAIELPLARMWIDPSG